jgi:hypothetical protein
MDRPTGDRFPLAAATLVQIYCEAKPDILATGIKRRYVKFVAHFHIVPQLRIHGALPPLSTSLYNRPTVKHKDIYTVTVFSDL